MLLKNMYIMLRLKIFRSNIENKIPDITNLAANASLNIKINEVKGEISNITNLATTSALTAVENKISNFSNLAKKLI